MVSDSCTPLYLCHVYVQGSICEAQTQVLLKAFTVTLRNESQTTCSSSSADGGVSVHKHHENIPRLVQVSHDLLQQRVQAPVHLGLFQQLDQLHVIGHQLTQVRHLLQDFGEQLERVGMVGLQLQLQRVKNRLLQVLDGLDVQQTWSICQRRIREDCQHL